MAERVEDQRGLIKRLTLFLLVVAVPVALGYLVAVWNWVLTTYETLRSGG